MAESDENPMRRAANQLRERIEHATDEKEKRALTIALASAVAAERKFYPR